MSAALVANVAAASAGGPSVTTGSINTTGANFIVVYISDYLPSSTTLSDNKSNTWTALTAKAGTSQSRSQLYYCYAPTVGAGHTFTAGNSGGSYPSISVQAWSGIASSPFDVENGGVTGSASSLQPGSVTPGSANEIVITGVGGITQGTISIDSGFTISDQFAYNGAAFGGSMAYLIQTTATAENPTWSWNGGANEASAVIATFKASGGGVAVDNLEWIRRDQIFLDRNGQLERIH
jgi:hypothetical protein